MGKKIQRIHDFLLSMRKEKIHRQAIIYLLIVGLLGAAVYFTEKRNPESLYKNIWDGIWWGFVTISSTGYGDKFPTSVAGRVIGIFIMVSGLVLTVTISGTIASVMVDRKLKEGQGLQKVNLNEHIVLCGWNAQGEKILEGFQTVASRGKKPVSIALVNELSIETLNEIQFSYRTKLLNIEFVRGKFTQEQVLDKANIGKANSVIILADSSGENTLANADERTILCVFSVSNMNPGAHISVELVNKQNEQHLKNTSVENIIVTGEFNSYMLVNSAMSPGIPQAAKEILNLSFGNILASEEIPGNFVGKKFGDAFHYFKKERNRMLVGIVSMSKKMSIDNFLSDDPSAIDEFIKRKFAESERDFFSDTGGKTQTILNPAWDYVIGDNDRALVIGAEGERGRS
ncbi:MAG TPA: potassium channel family protein [Spirochaetota bacterium]|nr:potassium channel family protein [Spirochaetota bacterium]